MVVLERCTKINDGAGFCTKGHELVGRNIAYNDRAKKKARCRTCHNAYMRAYNWRKRRAVSFRAAT